MTLAEEEIAFHYQLGKAITAWADVENTLRSILCACFDKGDKNINWNSLSVGLFSIDAFRAKMDFVEGTVLRRFPEHKERWNALVKRTRGDSASRNKLAHWSVKEYPDSSAGRRFVLIPWVFPKPKNKTKRPIPPGGSLGLRDVYKTRTEFIALAISLYNFFCLLQGDEEPHEASLEQPTNPPQIAKLRAQILEGLARQLQPSAKKP
jgi:hypothetical protein